MSSVSGVNASLISQINPQQTQQGQPGWKTNMDSVLQSLGVDSSKIPTIEQQMHDAAQAAIKGGGQDRGAAKQAVDSVLKNNGVDPAKFDAAMKAKMGKGHKGKHHGHHGGGQGVPAPATPAQATIGAISSAQVDVEG